MIADIHPFAEFSRRECFEYRIGLEGEAAALAARNHTEADLRRISEAASILDAAANQNGLGFDEDYQFHLAIATATGNAFFKTALSGLRSYIVEGMLLARTNVGLSVDKKLAAISHQHGLIYDAIASRDEDMARQAMRGHLRRCKQSTAHWNIYQLH